MLPAESAKWAKYHGKPEGLSAADPRFRGSVLLKHSDGSVLFYRHAFYIELDDELAVFTEHLGYHLFHAPHLDGYSYLIEQDVPPVS